MKSVTCNHPSRNRFHLFILAICIVLGSSGSVSTQSSIKYVYDELGRLVAVTDPAGDTVRYTYDAVGNILSISRQSSATLSLITFSPTTGPVGTLVTIYGTGFSTTPSQNTVTFNGVTATVSASTATQITTTVPSGATTGVIGVTTSAGSVSSSTSFTVAAAATPTISSLSPTIGPAGTSVTISGTNFDTTASRNKTKVNITNSLVSSATATSISTSVPTVSGSGKVSVTTSKGTAVSTDDFFVPPSPYTASDVSVTGRMTAGNSQTVTLSTAGKVGMIVFDATAGQRASVKVTSCSFTSVRISIYQPNGSLLGSGTAISSGGFIETTNLSTVGGTYTILVDPDSTYTGAVTFTLYTFNDLSGSITPNGSSVTVTTTTPAQRDSHTFSGTTGQRISLKATSGSYSGGSVNATQIYVKALDGTILGSVLVATTGYIDTMTLPASGLYTILTDPTTAATGSVTLTLYEVAADVTGSITAGGSAVTVTNTSPGQNGLHTFSGTANQRISLKISSGSYSGGSPSAAHVDIKKPDGSSLASVLVATTGWIDTKTLPTTGTYTVMTDPDNSSTGSLTLTLYDVAADITGSITPNGSAVTVTTTSPGQNALHTFSGTANQVVTIKVTSGSFTGGSNASWVTIKKPDGTELVSTLVVTTGFIDQRTLPTTGTYTVVTDPLDSSTGSLTVNLYDVVDSSGTVTIGGSAATVSTSVPGQNGTLTFSGTSSQQVTVHITNNTTSCVSVTLKQPNGSTLTSTFSCSSSFNLSQQTLPATGTYTIIIDPLSTNTGSLDVSVTNP